MAEVDLVKQYHAGLEAINFEEMTDWEACVAEQQYDEEHPVEFAAWLTATVVGKTDDQLWEMCLNRRTEEQFWGELCRELGNG